MEFNETEWVRRVKLAKTGEELNALAMEIPLPPEAEIGSSMNTDGPAPSTTKPPPISKRST